MIPEHDPHFENLICSLFVYLEQPVYLMQMIHLKTACGVNVIHLSTLKSVDGQGNVWCSAKSMPPKVNQPAVIFIES